MESEIVNVSRLEGSQENRSILQRTHRSFASGSHKMVRIYDVQVVSGRVDPVIIFRQEVVVSPGSWLICKLPRHDGRILIIIQSIVLVLPVDKRVDIVIEQRLGFLVLIETG